MSTVGTRSNKLSAVLAYEDMPTTGHCRQTVTVTMQTGMDIGAVLQLVSGKYVWVANADVATIANDVVVLIDSYKDPITLPAGDAQLAVLTRGPAGVVGAALQYKDAVSGANQLLVQAKLLAKGITIRTQV